jgi:hypothetical protein
LEPEQNTVDGQQSVVKALTPAVPAALAANVDRLEEKQVTPAKNPKKRRAIKTIKQWSWRLTAVWCWIHLVGYIFFRRDVFAPSETTFVDGLAAALSSIGFSPGNPALLPSVLKAGWIVVITGFSLVELMALFLFYIPLFPFGMPFLYVFRHALKADEKKKATESGLAISRRRKWSLSTTSFAALTAWFLLYGDSYSKFPLLLGVVLAGLLFIARSFSAFAYASPAINPKSAFIDGLSSLSITQATKDLQQVADKSLKKKLDVQVSLKFQKAYYFILMRIALFMRGSRGQSRGALIVLVQYTVTLLLLGTVTVLFWALVIRLFALPEHFSLPFALIASASHVLPGLSPPRELHIPLWIEAASSVSAWILLVIYAGPAASVFPALQQAYVTAISTYYRKLRSILMIARRHIRFMESLIPTLE